MAPTVKEIRDMREQQLEMNLQTNGLDPFSGSFQERQNRLIQFLHPSFEVMENEVLPPRPNLANQPVRNFVGKTVDEITNEVNSLKVIDLREELSTRSLNAKGLKQELRNRLLDHLLSVTTEEVETMLVYQIHQQMFQEMPKLSGIFLRKRVVLFIQGFPKVAGKHAAAPSQGSYKMSLPRGIKTPGTC